MKVRLRFGIKLGWPIANAATFVVRVDNRQADQIAQAVGIIQAALSVAGYGDVAARLICEMS